MFNELFAFEKQRTPKEAFGFYVVFVLLGIVLLALLGIIMGVIFPTDRLIEKATRYGQITAVVYPFLLSIVIARAKNSLNLRTFLLSVASALAGAGGIFFGLLVTMYVTTLPNRAPTRQNDQTE